MRKSEYNRLRWAWERSEDGMPQSGVFDLGDFATVTAKGDGFWLEQNGIARKIGGMDFRWGTLTVDADGCTVRRTADE